MKSTENGPYRGRKKAATCKAREASGETQSANTLKWDLSTPSVFCYGGPNTLIYPYHPQVTQSLDTLHIMWTYGCSKSCGQWHPLILGIPNTLHLLLPCIPLFYSDCGQSCPHPDVTSPRQGCILFFFASSMLKNAGHTSSLTVLWK